MLLPSSRCCKFQLSKDQESFMVEMIFRVQQGDSKVFVGSQPTEVGIPSTTWLEIDAMAEAKFSRHISRQGPRTAGTASACSSHPQPDGAGFGQRHLEDCANAAAEHRAPDTAAQEGFLAAPAGYPEVPALLPAEKITPPLCHCQ
ncbi:hypothetical protein TURU_014098 [Turdus rufiventris]|nr:hypothetical protein TURU_014098 [Turdus rufiventris]